MCDQYSPPVVSILFYKKRIENSSKLVRNRSWDHFSAFSLGSATEIEARKDHMIQVTASYQSKYCAFSKKKKQSVNSLAFPLKVKELCTLGGSEGRSAVVGKLCIHRAQAMFLKS